MKDVYGCDIGNAFAYISMIMDEKQDPQPMVPAELSKSGIPSTAYVSGSGDIEIYEKKVSANIKYKKEKNNLISSIKKHLVEDIIEINGTKVSPYDVYAKVVETLVREANAQREGRPIYKIVVTYPVHLHDVLEDDTLNRIQRSIENIELDGNKIEVVGRIPEPVAAAIDYIYFNQNISEHKREEITAVVYDLGHGTFDAAVVTANIKGEPYQVHAKGGDPNVGGMDFDNVLNELIRDKFMEKYPDIKIDMDIQEVNKIKEILTDLADDEEIYTVEEMYDGEYRAVEITRKEFEELSVDLVDSTIDCLQRVIEEAEVKGVFENNKREIVLSGGSSRMPMIRKKLTEVFGDTFEIHEPYRPGMAVSFGAARWACGIPDRAAANQFDQLIDSSNTVAEQYTDYALFRIIEFVDRKMQRTIEKDTKQPALSETVELIAPSDRFRISLIEEKENSHQYNIPFNNMEEGKKYFLNICFLEDQNIEIIMKDEDGNMIKKGTAYSVEEIIK